MSNEELVTEIKAGVNVADNMLALYEQMKGLVDSVARRYVWGAELEDLQQEGYLALYTAIDEYEPERGAFSTFAVMCIRRELLRYVCRKGSCISLPDRCRKLLNEYRELEAAYLREIGRKPTDREAMACLGVNQKQLAEIKRMQGMRHLASLDQPVQGADNDGTLSDMIPDPDEALQGVEDRLYQEQLSEALWGAVEGLEPEQAEVIQGRYKDGLTAQEIADRSGYSRSQAQSLERAALNALGKPHRARRLLPFYEEIRSMGLVRTSFERFATTWTSSTEYAALELYNRY